MVYYLLTVVLVQSLGDPDILLQTLKNDDGVQVYEHKLAINC